MPPILHSPPIIATQRCIQCQRHCINLPPITWGYAFQVIDEIMNAT
jgi:hypothetical protein